jgi:hypothetical protein
MMHGTGRCPVAWVGTTSELRAPIGLPFEKKCGTCDTGLLRKWGLVLSAKRRIGNEEARISFRSRRVNEEFAYEKLGYAEGPLQKVAICTKRTQAPWASNWPEERRGEEHWAMHDAPEQNLLIVFCELPIADLN